MKLLVDGVFFQLNNTGIARVWTSILALLARDSRFEIYFLDRGGAPKIKNVNYIPFPSMIGSFCTADSFLIQDVCDEYRIDVFSSTYYTTPISTPMVLVVYDMIPELFDFDMSPRIWREKGTAICYAQRFLCISENTRKDLLTIYPEILPSHAVVAHCGVDTKSFRLRDKAEIDEFKKKFGLDCPYFLFVGDRVQHKGYKNSELFFNALAGMVDAEFDVFCVGGEPEIEPSILQQLPDGVRCTRAKLTDEELSIAYGGALSLIYPSLYEGFGMPVIEAMASGCPVLTTRCGSLPEAAGDAAYTIDGTAVEEMRVALRQLQDPVLGDKLRKTGIEHARRFTWSSMATVFSECLEKVVSEADKGSYDSFFDAWTRLRQMQVNVDYTR